MKSLARGAFQVSQDYYPETYVLGYQPFLLFIAYAFMNSMGKVAVVNAPSTFAFIWRIMKPWMAKETQAKVDILGSNYKDVLLDLIDEENLPSVLGGKCTCGGKDGESLCHLSGAGPWMEGRVGWGPKAKAAQATTESKVEVEEKLGQNGTEV
jgi:hypothetical protein